MAIPAYNELYVNNARTTMATMLDFAVNYKHEQIDLFFIKWIPDGQNKAADALARKALRKK